MKSADVAFWDSPEQTRLRMLNKHKVKIQKHKDETEKKRVEMAHKKRMEKINRRRYLETAKMREIKEMNLKKDFNEIKFNMLLQDPKYTVGFLNLVKITIRETLKKAVVQNIRSTVEEEIGKDIETIFGIAKKEFLE